MTSSYFTTPPPPRPPAPKHPLFTRKVFATKSFGPGHVIGTSILVIGTVAIAKAFISRGQAETERVRLAAQPARPRSEDELAENERGQYGKRP
jgi:hypothetical protein